MSMRKSVGNTGTDLSNHIRKVYGIREGPLTMADYIRPRTVVEYSAQPYSMVTNYKTRVEQMTRTDEEELGDLMSVNHEQRHVETPIYLENQRLALDS